MADISITCGQRVYTSNYTGECMYRHLHVGFTGLNRAFDVDIFYIFQHFSKFLSQ